MLDHFHAGDEVERAVDLLDGSIASDPFGSHQSPAWEANCATSFVTTLDFGRAIGCSFAANACKAKGSCALGPAWIIFNSKTASSIARTCRWRKSPSRSAPRPM